MAKVPRPLIDKVVLVTGAGNGIGRALALRLHRETSHLAICDLDAAAVDAAVAEIEAQGGRGKVIGAAFDVADHDAFTAFIDRTEAELGPLDVLVNNAAIMPVGPFEDEQPATAEKLIDVNLRAVVHGTKEAVRRMKPRDRGHIVNVASGAGWVPGAGGATYAATKSAVVGLSESLLLELDGTGVDICVVAPGVVKTQMTAGLKDLKGVKAVTADDVAEAIVDGLKFPRFAIFVPASMGTMARAYTTLPYGVRGWLARVSGSGKLLLDADRQARGGYEANVLTSTPRVVAEAVKSVGDETPDPDAPEAPEIPGTSKKKVGAS